MITSLTYELIAYETFSLFGRFIIFIVLLSYMLNPIKIWTV